MSRRSREIVLAIGLTGMVIEAIAAHPAFAVDKIKLFKVVTPGNEIVIGLTKDELEQIHGKDAIAVSAALKEKGRLKVWQYGPRRSVSGQFEQAPVKPLNLVADPAIRVEPYQTALKIVPITDVTMRIGDPVGLKEVPGRGT